MKLLKILIILFFVSIYSYSNAWYNDIDSKTKQIYTKFYSQVKAKYKYDNWLSYLYLLNRAVSDNYKTWKVNTTTDKVFSDLLKLNNEKIFNLELENIEKTNKIKIWNNELLKNYKIFWYNNELIFKENWIWYTYIYSKKYFFEDDIKLNKETLIYNWIYNENILVFFDNNQLSFIKEYTKVKLVNDDIIYGFPNKYNLLKTIKNNKTLDSSKNDDSYFMELENTSKKITNWLLSNEEKVKKIYNYILENISYSTNFTMQDYEIFSWIETFKNKNWVCEWYVELFNLMLWFNNIESEIIIWDVIDAEDFPQIWHAWVKINEFYYDITFDDPVWLEKTKTFDKYEYYKLPKDLFYTNRFDKWKTPNSLKTSSIEYRESLIKINLSKLITKYKNENYNLLKVFKFKENYNLSPEKTVKKDDIISILWYNEMKNYEIVINWKIKYVKNLNYIILDDSTVETFLEQINFDLTWYTVLKWLKDDWSIEFIISNNITYHN